MPYRFGLIGAGRIGHIHATNIAANPDCELAYVADVAVDAAHTLAGRVGASVVSVDTMMADPSVDAVAIASSTDTHAELIIRAAQSGKAIFCEKPIDLELKRAEDCIKVVDDLKVPFLLGFNRRFDPHFMALRAKMDDGYIGTLEMLHITSRDPAPPPSGYIASSGGMFKDMTIHDLDMARWLLGEDPVEISVAASCLVDSAIGEAGDVDSALLTLKTATGKLCVISNSRRAQYGYDQRIEVLGSNGMISVGNVRETEVSVHTANGAMGDRIQHFFLERYATAYAAEMQHFTDVLAGRCAVRVSGADGLAALRLAEAANEAAASGLSVKL